MKKLIMIFIPLLMACNSETEKAKKILENRTWIRDSFKSIPVYFSDGVEYNVWPVNRKGTNIQSGVYLYMDSPKEPKENSKWLEVGHYKISSDTIYSQAKTSEKVHIQTLKVLPDTVIGIHKYYKIQMTAWRKEGDLLKEGLTYGLVSKKTKI